MLESGVEIGCTPASRRWHLAEGIFYPPENPIYGFGSPSDHFFDGAPENVRAFAAAGRECAY
jgi:hypothetical protein